MAQVIITINDREYPIACENGQEMRIMQLAQILDKKARMLSSFNGKISENMMLAMIGILVADDLFEAQKAQPAATPQNVDNSHTLARIQALDEKIKAVAKIVETL